MALLDKTYQLGEVIGKGAFGSVHRALNIQTGDFVAVKKYDREEVPEKEISQIVEEANLMKSLDHDNIVQFYGAWKDETSLYLIIEYVENGSLTKIIKTFGVFPEGLVRVYTEQVLKGLAYLHANGVIHRDIKGCNILVNKEGVAKLADFGVSSKIDATQKRFTVVGTPYWMAPGLSFILSFLILIFTFLILHFSFYISHLISPSFPLSSSNLTDFIRNDTNERNKFCFRYLESWLYNY
jgi:serine/threonine protein kinase